MNATGVLLMISAIAMIAGLAIGVSALKYRKVKFSVKDYLLFRYAFGNGLFGYKQYQERGRVRIILSGVLIGIGLVIFVTLGLTGRI